MRCARPSSASRPSWARAPARPRQVARRRRRRGVGCRRDARRRHFRLRHRRRASPAGGVAPGCANALETITPTTTQPSTARRMPCPERRRSVSRARTHALKAGKWWHSRSSAVAPRTTPRPTPIRPSTSGTCCDRPRRPPCARRHEPRAPSSPRPPSTSRRAWRHHRRSRHRCTTCRAPADLSEVCLSASTCVPSIFGSTPCASSIVTGSIGSSLGVLCGKAAAPAWPSRPAPS